jgi:gamma-glutamyltranspeptidase/glutathione hydrolase/leukotriene-C4 hydrolase
MGVTIPESMGLGGGSLIVVYNSTSGKTKAIDARERAPGAAYEKMYNETDYKYSTDGPLAIAIPGELAGYWKMHSEHGSGKISWSSLFVEPIKLCEEGFPVSEHLSTALKQKESSILEHKDLSDVYINPNTGKIYAKGEVMIQKQLGDTLRRLSAAVNPIKTFYEEIAQQIVEDLNKTENWTSKSIITSDDFRNYTIDDSEEAVVTHFDLKNITLHSFPLPGN